MRGLKGLEAVTIYKNYSLDKLLGTTYLARHLCNKFFNVLLTYITDVLCSPLLSRFM